MRNQRVVFFCVAVTEYAGLILAVSIHWLVCFLTNYFLLWHSHFGTELILLSTVDVLGVQWIPITL